MDSNETNMVGGDGESHGSDDPIDLVGAVRAQAALIEQLQRRLDAVEGAGSPAPERPAPVRFARPSHDEPVEESVVSPLTDAITSRRNLMGRAAALAAGAVVVGTAVTAATASPAAAAPGVFDGDPGVAADAVPGSGTAIRGQTGTGFGVLGLAFENEGPGVGVRGQATSGGGIGVEGVNFATTGAAEGVRGYSVSADGHGVYGWAAAGTGTTFGVDGESDSIAGTGVRGVATAVSGDTVGVVGTAASSTGIGVKGIATATDGPAHGVYGSTSSLGASGVTGFATHASGGTGVSGRSDSSSGVGVYGRGRWGVVAFGTRAQLNLQGTAPTPVATTNPYTAGDVVFDPAGDLWLCVANGSPGTWRRIGGTNTAGSFAILPSPQRVYDSRAGEPPATVPKTPLGVRVPRTIDCSAFVATGATAAMVSIVAINHTAGGFVSIYKDGAAYPGTSNLTFEANASASVTTVTALSTARRVTLYANVTTDVILDIIGYYR